VGKAISENSGLISREAHHVGSSPPENCSGTKEKVGEGQGGEESLTRISECAWGVLYCSDRVVNPEYIGETTKGVVSECLHKQPIGGISPNKPAMKWTPRS
jgi:hypothetical protein